MSDKVLYAIDIKKVVTYSLIGLVLGSVLAFVPIESLFAFMIILVGFIMIINNGIRLYYGIRNNDGTTNEMLIDSVGLLLGFILIIARNNIFSILVAIYLIVLPLVRMFLVKFNKESLMYEIPKLLLGVLLLISGIAPFKILFKIIGIITLIFSLIYLGLNYYLYKKSGIKIVK